MTEQATERGLRRRALSPVLAVDEFKPLSSIVRAEFAARSHRGKLPHNEDHYLVVRLARSQEVVATSLGASDVLQHFHEQGYAMVVADGIGASGSGALASRLALSTLAHLALHYGRWNVRVDGRTASEIVERAEWFYQHVSEAVGQRASRDPLLSGMSTTMTAAYSAGLDLFVSHVGHSRAYIFRDGELTQLTTARPLREPVGARRVRRSVDDRATEDLTHILTEALGSGSRLTVQINQFRIRDGDYVLLCTDGLTESVDDEKIADVLARPRQLDEQCELLVELALERGGPDNITVVLAQYHAPQP